MNTINTIITSNNDIKYIDLFAGTGAFSYCLQKINAKCVFSNDIEKTSETIYKLNYPDHNFVLGDLNKIDINTIPEFNILCGGFPCQPFSIAGQQKGFADERSNVFNKIIEIIQQKNPEIVLLENVKNLKSHDNGNTFKIIIDKLKKSGYYIKFNILDTSKITDVPHHRERIYIVCFKDKTKYDMFNFDFPLKENKQLKDILERDIKDKYYYKRTLKVYDIIEKEVEKHINTNTIYQYRRYYVRENKSGCCPTLTANMGSGGHNVPLLKDDKGIRKLTPKECFNLQGFPENYKFLNLSDCALYKLAGNAVSIPVVQLIIDKIYQYDRSI